MKKLLFTVLAVVIILGAYFASSYFTAEEQPAEAGFMRGGMPVRVEVAAAVRFLCGPGTRYITGQSLHINGGGYMA